MIIKFIHNRKSYDKCNFTTETALLVLTFGIQVMLPILEY